MAKPVVDGIEREVGEQVRFVRIAVTSSTGSAIAQHFGIRGVPTLLLVDGRGSVILTQVGRLDKAQVVDVLNTLR